jgi:hypothetical protein
VVAGAWSVAVVVVHDGVDAVVDGSAVDGLQLLGVVALVRP